MESSLAILKSKKANNLQLLANHKVELLKFDEVLNALSEIELMVANSGVEQAIANVNDENLAKGILTIIAIVKKSTGIITISEEEARIFIKMIADYYSDLTVKDLKLAFEFGIVGKLNEFLPKDREGKPDRNHYQTFTPYGIKMLDAYKQLRDRVWSMANKSKPELEIPITDEDKAKARASLILNIKIKFEAYKKNKDIKPVFIASFLALNLFKEAGIIVGIPTITDQDKSNALHQSLNSNLISPYRKHALNLDSEIVINKAKLNANNRSIVRLFDAIIRGGHDFDDILQLK